MRRRLQSLVTFGEKVNMSGGGRETAGESKMNGLVLTLGEAWGKAGKCNKKARLRQGFPA